MKTSRYFCPPLVAILLFFLMSATALASEKKGIGLANLKEPERVTALNVAWYYTWGPHSIEGIPKEKFVPMLWGGKRFEAETLQLKAHGKWPLLLAFNEPDRIRQSNMSVDEAIRRWPEVTQLADQVGSPAVAGVQGPWFDRFYETTRKRQLKLDFMTVHLYGPPDAAKFLSKIDATYNKYQLPIWITEFAVADFEAANQPGSNRYSEEQVLAFMKSVLPELEKRPYVKRYAWFGAGRRSLMHEQVRTSRLFDKDGKLTTLGHYYASFASQSIQQ